MKKTEGRSIEDVVSGDTIVIRRTSGAEQVATVHYIVDRNSMFYMAPELCVATVTFDVNGKKMRKDIRPADFIRSV